MFEKFTIFKQRKPREFNFKPLYSKGIEEEDMTAENRIRGAYGSASPKTMREKMEDSRHFGATYDASQARKKLKFLAIVLIAIIIWIIFF